MKVKDLQRTFDDIAEGGWSVSRTKVGFAVIRIDAVEAVSATEIVAIEERLGREFNIYVTTEARSGYMEDGVDLALHLAKRSAPPKATRSRRKR